MHRTLIAETPNSTPRSRGRRLARLIVVLSLAYVVLVATGCMNLSTPFDYLITLGTPRLEESLMADVDHPPVVVMQHGIWRSASALNKLERSLRAHGYHVINPSYPSTRGTLEEHAERLANELAETIPTLDPAPCDVYFVGHSMGGMVIAEYLRRDDALTAAGSIFLGTPHRGAIYADPRIDWWLYKVLMGTTAARQLATSDGFHEKPFENLGCVGTIIGGKLDDEGYQSEIPGDDDRRVGVAEAHHPDEVDSITLEMGHTMLTLSPRSIHQVLYFLKNQRFDHAVE